MVVLHSLVDGMAGCLAVAEAASGYDSAIDWPTAGSRRRWQALREDARQFARDLPGIGRASGPARLFYAIGHQHIGLTTAPITGELVADAVAGRTSRHPVAAFDLRRFGAPTYRP